MGDLGCINIRWFSHAGTHPLHLIGPPETRVASLPAHLFDGHTVSGFALFLEWA